MIRKNRAAPLILFGKQHYQDVMLLLHREGPVTVDRVGYTAILEKAGLVIRYLDYESRMIALDTRHPAFEQIEMVLHDLTGVRSVHASLPSTLPPHVLDQEQALGHTHRSIVRILARLADAEKPIDFPTLRRQLIGIWPARVAVGVERLIQDGLIEQGRDLRFRIATSVPSSIPTLMLTMAKMFAATNPRFAETTPYIGDVPRAFGESHDGAARLFATDARLRNLMALAVHGPLHYRELRRITNAPIMALESGHIAVFGRGAVTRAWNTDEGIALMLDPDYPLYLPLRRLLIALEKTYPLPVYVPRFGAPIPPPSRPWLGDRSQLFGGDIPTSILTSIGVHGWTYESLCTVIIHHDRWNIKKSMQRLEREGVIQGDRPRKPGFNLRVVTVSDTFPAKAELEDLLRAYVEAFPVVKDAVKRGFEKLAMERPRSKAHMLKRGLWPYALPKAPPRRQKSPEP